MALIHAQVETLSDFCLAIALETLEKTISKLKIKSGRRSSVVEQLMQKLQLKLLTRRSRVRMLHSEAGIRADGALPFF